VSFFVQPTHQPIFFVFSALIQTRTKKGKRETPGGLSQNPVENLQLEKKEMKS
jgi:hypothetical protein